jgi:hypothetical protein
MAERIAAAAPNVFVASHRSRVKLARIAPYPVAPGPLCSRPDPDPMASAPQNRVRRRSKMVGTTQLLVVIADGVVAGLEALMGLRAHLQSKTRQSDAFGSER